MLKLLFILIIMFSTFYPSSGQKEDHIWVFGDNPGNQSPVGGDTLLGGTNMDFNFDPVRIHLAFDRKWNMQGCNASICDGKTGKLLAYTNGQMIVNASNVPIEDTINYDFGIPKECREWERFNSGDATMAKPDGLLGTQNVIILPHLDKYFLLQTSYKYCGIWDTYRFIYHDFMVNSTTPAGQMVSKENLVLADTLKDEIIACRHANGRDWWSIIMSEDGSEIYVFLLDKTGITLQHSIKTGLGVPNKKIYFQENFSPDGRYLAWYLGRGASDNQGNYFGGFAISDFDRCTGFITNIKSTNQTNKLLTGGVAFSPDSKYLYVCNGNSIFQYETDHSDIFGSEKKVAAYDGFAYNYPRDTIDPINYSVNFAYLLPAPDGKIYVMSSSVISQYMSAITYPEESGADCEVRQHSVKLNTVFVRTIPNFPNYRLGPLDDSSCDTLGLDNHPIAKYRYEPDTIDYKRIRFTDLSYFRPETWSWDFGDNSPKISQRSPYHTYAQNGTYKVCLTVSNENSGNTSCRNITIGTSATDDDLSTIADVTLFPNPVQDNLLVTIGDYIPEHGYIEIYNLSGQQIHKQRAYYGHNNVDMSAMVSGTYVLRVVDGDALVKEVKVVKI
jgi:hypothetical protein